MINSVIFDADGPLYDRGSDVKLAKINLLRDFGYNGAFSAFEKAYDIEKFKAYDRTETAVAMFANILLQLGVNLDDRQAQDFTNRFNDIQSQISAAPYALDTLQWLESNNYRVCILTDSFYPAKEKWDWFDKLKMSDYIDEIVSSFDIKKLKSTKEAYHACLDALKVEAGAAIFVGHQQYEMDGAKSANIKSVCLKSISIPETTTGDYNLANLSELPDLLAKF